MRDIGKLTAAEINALSKEGRYPDGRGLYFRISKFQTKGWLLRFQLAGKEREMGLGTYPEVGLGDARNAARKARALLLEGKDPINERWQRKQALRAETAKRVTFKQAAEKYIAAHKAGWRNEKHADQWTATLTNYAYPTIGSLSVADIDTSHVMTILEPIWAEKTSTASRLRGRIESVLDWAKARHYRGGENPARWKGHVENLLPKRSKVHKVKHQPAMPFAQVPGFMAELRAYESVSARALEFTILSAARTSEAIHARWDEFDLAAKVWIVPGERMKSGREHRVPLSARLVEILGLLPRIKGTPFVFPGGRYGKPLSGMAMLMLLRGMRGRDCVPHGFRSSFRDWAGEVSTFPREIAEAALAHVVGDASENAYRRGDALEKRRKLMEAWSGYCSSSTKSGSVTQIRKVA